jgi:hypothetical protein
MSWSACASVRDGENTKRSVYVTERALCVFCLIEVAKLDYVCMYLDLMMPWISSFRGL